MQGNLLRNLHSSTSIYFPYRCRNKRMANRPLSQAKDCRLRPVRRLIESDSEMSANDFRSLMIREERFCVKEPEGSPSTDARDSSDFSIEMKYNLILTTVINEELFPDGSSRSLQRGRIPGSSLSSRSSLRVTPDETECAF